MTAQSSTSPSEHLVSLQHTVQRKLGRCVIHLQQYEHLMKALLINREIEGTASTLKDIQSRRKDVFARKTLGQVVGTLTEDAFVTARPESPSSADNPGPTELTEPWFRHCFSIGVREGDHARLVADLSGLVELRNQLVHHFVQQHDIWTEAGCLSADAHLDRCFEQIDQRYQELRGWVQSMNEAREITATFMASREFEDMFVHGILPSGAGVIWPSATVVELLRNAEAKVACNGWTLLSDAIKIIQTEHPDHTPKRYGCRNWRQLLRESGLFSVRKEVTDDGQRTQIWFQSRPAMSPRKGTCTI